METNEQNVKPENEGKSKKTALPIIIILVVIILILGGLIFLNKDKLLGVTEKNTTEEKEKETIDEPVTFTDEELQKYVDYIAPVSYGPSKIYKIDQIVASELTARDKIEYVGSHVFQKHKSGNSDLPESLISEEDVKTIVENIYGENSYERTTFNLNCGDYNFKEEDGNYHGGSGCGGTSDTTVKNLVIDYKATKKSLEITTAYVFLKRMDSSLNDGYGLYKGETLLGTCTEDEVHAQKGSNEKYLASENTYLTNYINEHKDELNHMVYTFESTDGVHYYFKKLVNNK